MCIVIVGHRKLPGAFADALPVSKNILKGERCKCAGTAFKAKPSVERIEAFRSCFTVLAVENEHFERFRIGINEDCAC